MTLEAAPRVGLKKLILLTAQAIPAPDASAVIPRCAVPAQFFSAPKRARADFDQYVTALGTALR